MSGTEDAPEVELVGWGIDWPELSVPGDSNAGPVQLKSAYSVPNPVNWRDCPIGVELVSSNPISVLSRPLAAPLLAVKEPS